MFGKSAFGTGAPTTSFGFGTTAAAAPNPFGTGQLFGKPAGGFGSPSTSAFGQPATTSLFPSSQAQPNNLFQNAGTGFGTPASTPSTGFGTTTLFGQQQQPAAGGLFNTSSTFGQQNKPAAFGFGAQPAQPTLFGQQAAQPQTSGMFQPSTSNLFGTTSAFGQQSTGTGGVKFNAVTGTDTMLKNGVSNSINTKLHSITCMKDYESKSFEELRYEDYAANRKGPQQQSGFGATPFGNQVSSAPSLFGQPDASKPAFTGFGQSTSTFGQNTGFGMPNQQPQTGGLFGKPATGFATPTSTSSLNFGFGSNTQTNNPFGAAQQPKAFGSVTPSIFGTNTATTQQSGFNTGGGLFGQTNTQNTAGSIFGKPAQPTVGFGTAPNANFSFSTPAASTQASSLFQPNKPIFGQTSTTPAFGQTTNTFGTNTFGSTLGKPAAPAFGTTPTPAFGNTLGTGLQPQAAPLFGNNAVKPGGFFNNTGTTGLGTFQSNTFPTNTGFNLQPQAAQQSLFPSAEQQTAANLALLTADPFGDAPHLAGLEPKLKSSPAAISATDPKELKSLLDASNKVTTSTGSKLRVVPIRSIKDSLFDVAPPPLLDDSKDYIKTNCRKLVLKSRPSSGESNSPAFQRMDILKHLETPDTPINDENVNIQNIRYSATLQNEIRPHVKLNFENTINNDSSLPIGSPTFILDNSVRNNSHENIQKNNRVSVEVDIEPTESGGSGDCVKGYPCNIVCTRPEYYTLPPPEELMKYVDEDGRCIVKGFTIGRKGYGNVYFPEEMDVSGLNLDEFVHFRYREINIYPDDDKKPPIGQGLNRKAQVTLDNVYPKRPGSNTLVKDINELQLMNFSEKLRKVTENKDAKFVDYRPETGSWVFKVDHFSRYGYDESDDEAAPLSKEAAEKKAAEKAAKAVVIVPKPVEKQVEKETVEQTSPTKSQVPKFGLDDDIFVEEGAHFQPEDDLIETAMYVDNISEEDYHVIPTDMPLHLTHDPFTSCKNIQVMKSTLFAEDDRSSDGGGSHISIIRQYLDIPEEIRRMPVLREECPPKKRVMLRPKVEKVYNYGKKEGSDDLMEIRSYQDMGIFRGKSYKVGWSKGFNFYNVVSKPEGGIQLTLNDIKCGSIKNFEAIDEILGKSLEIVLEESSYELDSNNVPTFTITKNARYLKKQSNLFSTLLERHNTKEARYLHSIWTLADSLWGPSENTVSNRRYLLSEWLRMNTNYDEPSQEPAQEIFNNLSVFKINEAANLAIDKRLPNLSLILSQLSLTNRTKMFLQEQIESWYQSMSSNHISEDMKKIYLLLSGIPIKDEVNIFENIDWKRAFGMHMWYVSPCGAPIEMVIELYKKAFEEYNYAELPNPPYESTYTEENSFDLLYHILVLYQSRAHRLSTVLNSATHTDNHLDYWLSWLLLQLFLSLDVGIMDDAEKNKLCTSFSNQLESLGEWEWSILVLLHLKDNALKKTLVMQILDRNLSPDVDKEGIKSENNLVNNMQIPPEWIHRVKGEKTLLSQRYFEAFNHFAYAKDYCKANDILVEHLLPSLFINEQYDIIKLLIREIEDGSADIENWNSEAGLFKDFMELQERYVSASDNLKLQMNLQNISNRIASFVPKTNHQKLCIAEMSKRCASVYKEFCKKSQSSLFRNSYLEFIESLNMPPEFKQNEALYSINEIGAKC